MAGSRLRAIATDRAALLAALVFAFFDPP